MPTGFDNTKIANLALSNVGSKSRLTTLGSDGTTPDNICNLWFESARIATFEVFDWSFARFSATLTAHSEDAPEERWAYRYDYPSDCVAARRIENPLGDDGDAVAFRVERAPDDTKCIVTDQEDAVLIYTKDVTDPAEYPMHFTLMMGIQLAVFICPELTGKIARRDRLQRDFNIMLAQAPYIDQNESVPKEPRDAPWHRARN